MKVHPGVRINTHEGNKKWIVENIITRKKVKLSSEILVSLLFELSTYENIDKGDTELKKKLSEKFNINLEDTNKILESFFNLGILIENSDPLAEWGKLIFQKAHKYNWVESMDYHLVSYDYPFLDYTSDARKIDRARMTEYSSISKDNNRYKVYSNPIKRIPAPKPSKSLCPSSLEEALYRKIKKENLTKESLLKIMSMTFGTIGYYTPPWENAERVLRKTSPSGGARHPSEGYILVLDVPDVTPGYYHFSVKNSELELLSENVVTSDIKKALFGPYERAPFKVQAIVIITSIFERNMYRYREPRTFRSIHMDVGHLCATLEYVAAGLGINSFPHYGIKESAVEQLLGLFPLEEGAFMGISLGRRDKSE